METFYLSAIVSIGLAAIVFAFLAKRVERLSFRTVFWTTILLFPLPIFMAAGHVGGGGFVPGIVFLGGLLYFLVMSLVELDFSSVQFFLLFSIVPLGFLWLVYVMLKRKFKSTSKPFSFRNIFILLGIEVLGVFAYFITGNVQQSVQLVPEKKLSALCNNTPNSITEEDYKTKISGLDLSTVTEKDDFRHPIFTADDFSPHLIQPFITGGPGVLAEIKNYSIEHKSFYLNTQIKDNNPNTELGGPVLPNVNCYRTSSPPASQVAVCFENSKLVYKGCRYLVSELDEEKGFYFNESFLQRNLEKRKEILLEN